MKVLLAGRQGFVPSRDESRAKPEDEPTSQRRSKSEGVGWEAGIRTPIPWSRATCPTVGRPPSTSRLRGEARTCDYSQSKTGPAIRARLILGLPRPLLGRRERLSHVRSSSGQIASHHP